MFDEVEQMFRVDWVMFISNFSVDVAFDFTTFLVVELSAEIILSYSFYNLKYTLATYT